MRARTTVTLRTMTPAEFAVWRIAQIAHYAEELAEAGAVPAETAATEAERQHDGFLPQGLATPGMLLLRVLDGAGTPVGALWLGIHPRTGAGGFVYDVEIDEARRGEGLGRATMLAAEGAAIRQGWRELGLNVFGPNERARALYDSLGYGVVNTNMKKRLAEH